MNYEELTDEQIDKLYAEKVLGIAIRELAWTGRPWCPTRDRHHSRMVTDKVNEIIAERTGNTYRQDQYRTLWAQFFPDDYWWEITPRQECIAALMALDEVKG